MRYLFVTWDGGGNLNSSLHLARRLVSRGHEVRFLGHRSQQPTIEGQGCSFTAFARAPDSTSTSDRALLNDWDAKSLLGSSALYRDKLMVGPAALFAADVLAEVERDKPDAIAVDFMLFGAVAGAERSGLPSAVLWHTVYAPPTVKTPVFGLGRGLPKGLPGKLGLSISRRATRAWWGRSLSSLNATRAGLGLAPLRSVFDQYDRLDRVLAMSSAAFDFTTLIGARIPDNVRYVGPQVSVADSDGRAQALTRDDPPLVLVSFSTTYMAQQHLLRRAIDALGTLPVRALVTTGPAVSLSGGLPANVEVRPWVAHSEVLPRASLVLTHAGHGTVTASLAHGVPLVCIPMGRDQPCVAARVVHSGAGLRLSKNPSEAEIAKAVRRALGDPAMSIDAERLRKLLVEEIAADRGVEEMEALTAPAPGAAPRPRTRSPADR